MARMRRLTERLRQFGEATIANGELGQGLAEYALIFTIITVVSIALLAWLGSQISTTLSAIGTSVGNTVP